MPKNPAGILIPCDSFIACFIQQMFCSTNFLHMLFYHAACSTSKEEEWCQSSSDVSLLCNPRITGAKLPRNKETKDTYKQERKNDFMYSSDQNKRHLITRVVNLWQLATANGQYLGAGFLFRVFLFLVHILIFQIIFNLKQDLFNGENALLSI